MPRKAIHPLNTLGTVTEWASENWANSRRATWITLNGHRPTLIMHQSTSTSSSLTIIVRLLVKICCKRQEGKGMQGWSLLVSFVETSFHKVNVHQCHFFVVCLSRSKRPESLFPVHSCLCLSFVAVHKCCVFKAVSILNRSRFYTVSSRFKKNGLTKMKWLWESHHKWKQLVTEKVIESRKHKFYAIPIMLSYASRQRLY